MAKHKSQNNLNEVKKSTEEVFTFTRAELQQFFDEIKNEVFKNMDLELKNSEVQNE